MILTAFAAAAALPPYVPATKRMADPDIEKKKVGWFLTGLPAISADPINGAGAAFNGYLYFNGDRADPFFAYTPYRAKLGIGLQQTTGNSAAFALNLDAPYVADSPWRLKLDLKYENDPNKLFYGLTEATLGPTSAPDPLFNRFREQELMGNLKLERSILDGNTRLLMGYELQHLRYETLTGQARLDQAARAGEVFGLPGGLVSLIQTGLIFDTRDFEPDPSRGLVLEAANEVSGPLLGSQFTFDKLFFQAKHFQQLWPERFARTVLATRVGYGTIFGDQAPFFEYQDQWSTEGSINGLGGAQTLRGYKANRFLGRTVAFANVELRHRFAEVDVWGQNLTFAAVPFLDLGAIGDRLFVPRLDQPRAAAGAGLRIGWNRSTMVLLDYAVSPEDGQLFLNFNKSY